MGAAYSRRRYAKQYFLKMVIDGDEQGVLRHIQEGHNINLPSKEKYYEDQISVSWPFSPGQPGRTALTIAAALGRLRCVEILLDSKAEMDLHFGNKFTALSVAVLGQHRDVVFLLLKRGAKIGSDLKPAGVPLNCAAQKGDNDLVNILLYHGAAIRINQGVESSLIYAARGGHYDTVKLLLDSGADINQYGENGAALAIAASKGHCSVVKLLLDSGANIDFHIEGDTSGAGYTALMLAAEFCHDDVLEVLIAHKANCRIQNSKKENVFNFILDPYIRQLLEETHPVYNRYDSEFSQGYHHFHPNRTAENCRPPRDNDEKLQRRIAVSNCRCAKAEHDYPIQFSGGGC